MMTMTLYKLNKTLLGSADDRRAVAHLKAIARDRLIIPRATCCNCGVAYAGFILELKEVCDCGGKLVVDWPYDVIFGYIRSGNRKSKGANCLL
jgi:hypothetical protein